MPDASIAPRVQQKPQADGIKRENPDVKPVHLPSSGSPRPEIEAPESAGVAGYHDALGPLTQIPSRVHDIHAEQSHASSYYPQSQQSTRQGRSNIVKIKQEPRDDTFLSSDESDSDTESSEEPQTAPDRKPKATTRGEQTGGNEAQDDTTEQKKALIRSRNRQAAQKFRQRKRRCIEKLQEKEATAKKAHDMLIQEVVELRNEVFMLKNMVLTQGGCGCPPIKEYIDREARNLSQGWGSRSEPGRPAVAPPRAVPDGLRN